MTSTQNEVQTTVITCSCKVCTANGGPLSARVPQTLLDSLSSKKARHGLVYYANEPGSFGEVTRARLNIRKA